MPDALWEKLLNYGALGVFVAVMIWLYVRAQKMHREDFSGLMTQWNDAHEALQLVVKENTRAFTEMLATLQEMRRSIDRWDGIERRTPGSRLRGG